MLRLPLIKLNKLVKRLKVEVRHTLKDKFNNYPFKLIKDVENTY